MFHSWIQRISGFAKKQSKPATRRLTQRPEPRLRFCPRLELLEDRMVLTACFVNAVSIVVSPGDNVQVPITTDTLSDGSNSGLSSAQFVLYYDFSALTPNSANNQNGGDVSDAVDLGTLLQNANDNSNDGENWTATAVNSEISPYLGILTINLASNSPYVGTGGGSKDANDLVFANFVVSPNASSGSTEIDLGASSNMVDGPYNLNPAPLNNLGLVQTLNFSGVQGGTFSLVSGIATTGPIAYSAAPATLANNIQSALNKLSDVAPGQSLVFASSSTSVTIEFLDATGAQAIPLKAVGTNLGGTNPTIAVSITGNTYLGIDPNDSSLNITPAPHFAITGTAAGVTAGNPTTFTVTAQNANNNTNPTYTGTVHFTSTDVQAGLPADYTFTSADNGVHVFTATLKTAGHQTLTATDTSFSVMQGTSNTISVSAAAATHFSISAPATSKSGSTFTFTVRALDAFTNTATSYNGTIQFTSSDPQAALPANATLTKGVGVFGAVLKTGGNQTITGNDTTTPTVIGNASITDTGVPPIVAVNNASVTVPENVIASNSGTFSDQTEAVTISVLSGGGSVTQTGSLSGTWTWTEAGDESNSGIVTIQATNVDNTTATTTFAATFTDLPPVITANNPSVFAAVNAAASNSGVFSDYDDTFIPPGDLSASQGAVVDNGNGTWSWTETSTQGSTATVTITAKNSNNTTATTTFSVTFSSNPGAETWTGAVSTNWSTPGNWSSGFVPLTSTNATIPAGPANQPVLTAASAVFTLTINSGATLNANGNTMTVGGLTTVNGTYNGSTNTQMFGGGLALTGGIVSGSALVLGGDVTTSATSVFSSINGNLNLSGARNFTVALGTAGIDLFISAVVSNGSLTKLGAGDLTLTNSNTYAGSTTILGGTLGISADNNLGTPPSAATPGDLVINGGTLQVTLLGAPNPGNIALNSNRGIALGPTSGTGTGTIDVTDGELDYGGVIANNGGGIGGLIKTDLGQLTLSHTSTYTGPTVLQSGLVVVQANGALGGAGAAGITVNSGAELNLSSGTAYTIPEALTLNGNGVSNTGQGVFVGNNISWAGQVTLGANSFVRSTNNTITFNGAINLAGFQLQINNAALTNNNRTILSSTCTVNGPGSILVSAGTLQVDGVALGIPVSVNSGAVLTGKGAVGAITVNAGGTVNPGDPTLAGVGTLNAASANFLGASTLLVRLTGNTGTGVTNDKLALSGALNLFNATLSVDLTGLSKAGTLSSQSYAVASGSAVSGTFASPVTLFANPNGHALPIATYPSNTVFVNFIDVGSSWLDGAAGSGPAIVPNIGQAGTQTPAKNAAPVIVAVLDTGVEATGQTGVLPGWNFVANNSNTADDNGHGTYIASLVTSVDPNAEILPLKTLDANGQGTTAWAIAAVDYAIDRGAKIIVGAWDITDQSPAWAAEVQKAESTGVLLVMAAGNNNQSLLGPLAAVHSNNVVVVGASDSADQLASFSNADPSVVDLAAPGVNILGAQLGAGEAAHSGTSVSTALVAGTAALEWGQRPNQSYQQVVAALLAGANQEASLADGVAGGRELNVLGALEADALPAATQVGRPPAGLPPTVTVDGIPAEDAQAPVGPSVDGAAHMPVQIVQQQAPTAMDVGMTSISASKAATFGGNLNSASTEAVPVAGSSLAEAFTSDTALPWLTSLDKGVHSQSGAQKLSSAQDPWSDSQDWLDLEGDFAADIWGDV